MTMNFNEKAPATGRTILEVTDLTLAVRNSSATLVEKVSFTLREGEVLCFVGESGSGKSLCASSLMGLLPPEIEVCAGTARFDDLDLYKTDRKTMRGICGRRIAMVFQEPMTSLNPLMSVGAQIAEVFEIHGRRKEASPERIRGLLAETGLTEVERIARSLPHQLSGGQRQRVMIAMALALEPEILIADEPPTAQDVTTQAQILKLIAELRQRRKMAVIFITHDFGVVADIADRVHVLQKGKVVESGTAEQVLRAPKDPYTKRLLAAIPSLNPPERADSTSGEVVCEIDGISKTYTLGKSLFGSARTIAAVSDISLKLHKGEVVGIVGESGSGKSTVARMVVTLSRPDSGEITVKGVDLLKLRGRALREQRRSIQMVFQDPFGSLNPRQTIGYILSSGPVSHGVSRAQAMKRAAELLEVVSLPPDSLNRFPHEFSGGQRQRIGIARALALDPDVLVADEMVSALDVSVQAQMLDLLEDLKHRLGLTILFITHDMAVAARMCDRIAVMRKGSIVELRRAGDLFAAPEHPYTQALLAAVPGRGLAQKRPDELLEGRI